MAFASQNKALLHGLRNKIKPRAEANASALIKLILFVEMLGTLLSVLAVVLLRVLDCDLG